MKASLRTTAALFLATIVAAAGPPPTPTVDHTETLFGITINDYYYWMEAGGPDFEKWITAQATYARGVLDAIPGRAGLLDQLQRLNSGETRVGATVLAGGQWVYSKARPDDAVAEIFVRPATGGTERVLIDPTQFDAGQQAAQLDCWSVSPDGRYIAYGVSLGGAEIGTLRIRRVDTGIDLPEEIDRTRYARPSWLDDASFLYSRLPAPQPGGAQRLTGGQVLVHRLGTDPAADVAVFGPGLVAGVDVPADFFFRGLASPGNSVVVGEYDAGLTSSPKVLYTTARESLGRASVWRRVARFEDHIRDVVLHGDMLYLRTARNAPRQRILRTSAIEPDLASAETVVAEGAWTIQGMAAAADALYVELDDGGLGRLFRMPWDGVPGPVALPFNGAIIGLTAGATEPGVVLRMQGWTHSQTVFAYDPAGRRFTDTGIAPPSPVSFDDIESIEVRALRPPTAPWFRCRSSRRAQHCPRRSPSCAALCLRRLWHDPRTDFQPHAARMV